MVRAKRYAWNFVLCFHKHLFFFSDLYGEYYFALVWFLFLFPVNTFYGNLQFYIYIFFLVTKYQLFWGICMYGDHLISHKNIKYFHCFRFALQADIDIRSRSIFRSMNKFNKDDRASLVDSINKSS